MGTFDEEERRILDVYEKRPAADWRYSWLNPAHVYLAQEQHRAVLGVLGSHRQPLQELRILDVGCGTGHWLRQFVDWGVPPEQIAGIDLRDERVAAARQRCPAGVTLHTGSAAAIPEPDQSFDVVLQLTVFTSILDTRLRSAVASEMLRVLKPGGLIVWYDFHTASRANPDVRAIGRAEIAALFTGCAIDYSRISLAPPLARAFAARAIWMCRLLNTLPLLRTHYLATIRKS